MRSLLVVLTTATVICVNAQMRTTFDQIQQGGTNAIIDTGGDDAYVGCPAIPITGVQFGTVIILKPSTTNTGAAQLTLNGACVSTTLTVVRANGSTLSDSLLEVGGTNVLVSDGTNLRFMGSGATALSALTDAQLTSLADKQGLFYDTASGKWMNRTITAGPSGGLDCTVPWQCDIVPTVVPRLAAPNSWSARNDFTAALKPPTGTAAPSSGTCDEPSEYGDLYVRYSGGTAGQRDYRCTASGWELQGAAGGSITGQTVTYVTERFSKFAWITDGGTAFPAMEWQLAAFGSVNQMPLAANGPFSPAEMTNRMPTLEMGLDATNDRYYYGFISVPSDYTNFTGTIISADPGAAGTATIEVSTGCYNASNSAVFTQVFSNPVTATYTSSGVAGTYNSLAFTDIVTSGATRTCAPGSFLAIRIARKAGGSAITPHALGMMLKFTHQKVQ